MSASSPEQIEFFRAVASGDEAKVRSLVSQHPDALQWIDHRNFGATPLTSACFGSRPKMAELLLDLGADPDRCSQWHMGPWSPLHCALYRHDRDLVRMLLSRGASLDVHTAAGLGDCDAINRLLDADPARVNQRGGDGCQPLHFADTVDAARLLLERGAEINGRCVDHYSTPAQYLCTCRPEVARYLLISGAEPDIFSAITCGDDETVEKLLKADPNLIQARINQVFFPPSSEHDVHNILTFTVGQDSTPLHAAARANRSYLVVQLMGHGLSANVRGGYDQGTSLHTAAWHHCLDAARALVDNGADMEARSGRLHNNTPAGWAIVSGADEVFEFLMDRGAVCHPWFVDDARDACQGRFDQVTTASAQQRSRILARLTRDGKA